MSLILPSVRTSLFSLVATDADARDYIRRVQEADGQSLERGVQKAINDFVVGCKNDGIWPAIKACCVLAGARTLSGALVPLVGPAPTNFNFVSGDYNRKTGLVGDASTKYLNSNRNNNADPQDSKHMSVYATTAATSSSTNTPVYIGVPTGTPGISVIYRRPSNGTLAFLANRQDFSVAVTSDTGLLGVSRSSASSFTYRSSQTSVTASVTSETPSNAVIGVFWDRASSAKYSNARLAFYSIGESLNLSLLDARVTALVNAIAAALP